MIPKGDLELLAGVASRMHLLMQTEGWDEYRKQLAELEARQMEGFVTEPKEGHDLRRGIVQGLRQAAHLPDLMIEHYRKALESSSPGEKKPARANPL